MVYTARDEALENVREMEPDMFRPDESKLPMLEFRPVTAAFLLVFEGATNAPKLKFSSSAMDNLGSRRPLG